MSSQEQFRKSVNKGKNAEEDSTASDIWNKIFDLHLGDKVKVVRIWHKERLKTISSLTSFIGRVGEVTDITKGWYDEYGWYDSIIKNQPNAIPCSIYKVIFTKAEPYESKEWIFMREDLELLM